MSRMSVKSSLPFVVVKCLLLLSAVSAQHEAIGTNSSENGNDVFIFMPNAIFTIPYYKMHTPNMTKLSRKMFIKLSQQIHAKTMDFHPPTKRIFFTMERVGYWTKNSQIYSIPWNPDYVCKGMFETSGNDEGGKEDADTNLYDYDEFSTFDDVFGKVNETLKCKTVSSTGYLKNALRYGRMKHSNSTLIREEENWNPRSIAVDYIGNKLYVVVTNDMAVNVYDLDGQNKAIVFQNDSVIPLEVVIDVTQGLMFVLGYNNEIGSMQIYRANMDGTSALLILENKEELEENQIRDRMGFAISALRKRIYFPNFEKSIFESVDYEGKGRVTIGNTTHPSSVTAYNDTVYWSKGSFLTNDGACYQSEECSFWSCQIDGNGSCIENSTKLFEKRDDSLASHSIKAVVTNPIIPSTNPCEVDNGGCEHHCLLRHSSTEGSLDSGCVCREGYRLSENLKNCTNDKTKVTSVYDDFYLPKQVNLTSLSKLYREDIFPISKNLLYRLKFERPDRIFIKLPFTVLEIEENGKSILENEIAQQDSTTSDLSKDSQLFIVGSRITFYECKTNYGDVVVTRSPNGFAKVLSYDWITKNLYFVKLSNSSEDLSVLAAMRFELPERICLNDQKPIFQYKSKRVVRLAKIPEPVSLAVHSYRGYLFASLRNGSLIRLNTDGSDKIILPDINNSISLAIDLNDDKIYWLDSDQYLNSANLDGFSRKRLTKSPVKQVRTMKIYDDWIYITDEKKLWRFDKVTGKASGMLEDVQDIQHLYRESLGFKVPFKYTQFANDDCPCAIDNGNCESLCFQVPSEEKSGKLKKVCA